MYFFLIFNSKRLYSLDSYFLTDKIIRWYKREAVLILKIINKTLQDLILKVNII